MVTATLYEPRNSDEFVIQSIPFTNLNPERLQNAIHSFVINTMSEPISESFTPGNPSQQFSIDENNVAVSHSTLDGAFSAGYRHTTPPVTHLDIRTASTRFLLYKIQPEPFTTIWKNLLCVETVHSQQTKTGSEWKSIISAVVRDEQDDSSEPVELIDQHYSLEDEDVDDAEVEDDNDNFGRREMFR